MRIFIFLKIVQGVYTFLIIFWRISIDLVAEEKEGDYDLGSQYFILEG